MWNLGAFGARLVFLHFAQRILARIFLRIGFGISELLPAISLLSLVGELACDNDSNSEFLLCNGDNVTVTVALCCFSGLGVYLRDLDCASICSSFHSLLILLLKE